MTSKIMTYETMRTFFALLTLVANVAVAVAIVLAVGGRWSEGIASLRSSAAAVFAGHEISLAFFVALSATLGSLYLSDVAHLIPCTYCWYQRIAMYPLVLLFGIAWIRKDPGIRHYAIPMAGIGLFIASYHYLIQRVPSLGGPACSSAVPCTSAWFYEFGYMSIPYMAGSAFALILVLMLTMHVGVQRG
jgi:disulfide bond formation protein DsbB